MGTRALNNWEGAEYLYIRVLPDYFLLKSHTKALEPRGQRGQLRPFLITIELFYHANNFESDVQNVINESELIVAGRHWSMIGKFICAIVKYNKTNYSTINLVVYSSKG